MGFRIRKSVKFGKGVKLNFGKKSAGVSFGGRCGGVSINSRTGTTARASFPGTGISYSTKLSGGKKRRVSPSGHARDKASVGPTEAAAHRANAPTRKALNPPKPPKSPKIYRVCGIIVAAIGFLMLFLCWPVGLIFAGFGIYYIAYGSKIYANLVAKYKAVHPEYKENT